MSCKDSSEETKILQFRLGASCYLTGGLSTINKVFNHDIELPELDDFSLEDCGCWQDITFDDGKSLITISIYDNNEDLDKLIINLNKFSGSSLDDLEKFLKKKRIKYKCSTY